MSSGMTAFEIETSDGEIKRLVRRNSSGYALRDNPRAAAVEFALLGALRSSGLPVPTPYYFDESAEIFPEPYLVIEYFDGKPEFAPADPMEFVAKMAAGLAEIHRLPRSAAVALLSDYAPIFVRQREHPQTRNSIDLKEVRSILERAWPLRPLNQPALLHGDYWAGNVVWNEDRIVGVIDWEEARRGDPVIDVAISRLDILWILGIDAMHEFTRCYRSLTNFDFGDLPFWDLDAALRPSFNIDEWASAWPSLGRPDVTEATMRAGHAQFVERALLALTR